MPDPSAPAALPELFLGFAVSVSRHFSMTQTLGAASVRSRGYGSQHEPSINVDMSEHNPLSGAQVIRSKQNTMLASPQTLQTSNNAFIASFFWLFFLLKLLSSLLEGLPD